MFIINVIKIINTNIFKVCFNADLITPFSSQWQCSSSQICPISFSSSSSFVLFLSTNPIIKSINIPAIIPIISFIPNIFNIIIGETASEIM